MSYNSGLTSPIPKSFSCLLYIKARNVFIYLFAFYPFHWKNVMQPSHKQTVISSGETSDSLRNLSQCQG